MHPNNTQPRSWQTLGQSRAKADPNRVLGSLHKEEVKSSQGLRAVYSKVLSYPNGTAIQHPRLTPGSPHADPKQTPRGPQRVMTISKTEGIHQNDRPVVMTPLKMPYQTPGRPQPSLKARV